MNADVVHLVGQQLLDFEQNLRASLQLEFRELYRLEVHLLQVAGDLRLQVVRILKEANQMALFAARLHQLGLKLVDELEA